VSLDTWVVTLQADARRLKQMLVNLLSNAVKFTPAGGKVGLEVRGDAAQGRVQFTVWDTGIGIAPADLEKLFKPFVQLDSRLAREYSGTGLGLSLVRGLAELHGGSVAVESTLGQGSRFSVVLPWSLPGEPAASASRVVRQAVDLEAALLGSPELRQASGEMGQAKPVATVLLAEDSEYVIGSLVDVLETLDCRVVVARDGYEALQEAHALYPNLILMDIQMPGVDGLEVTRRLRADPDSRLATVPIIALTALAMSGDRERCLAAGATDYMTKPVKLEQLLRLVYTLLKPSSDQ